MMSFETYPVKRVNSITFARGVMVLPYYTVETYHDTPTTKLQLTDWLPILHRYIQDGVMEIIVSGNSSGRFLRTVLPSNLPIYTVGDLEKMDALIPKAEYYYPIFMACNCHYWKKICNNCSQKKAMATLLYMQNRI